MRVYLDSSALLKRAVLENESAALAEEIERWHRAGALLLSSSLAWTEVARALRNRTDSSYAEISDTLRQAMLGIAEQPLDFEVMNLSRRLEPNSLRSLDAIHLAAAITVDADLLLAYDKRLLDASAAHGVPAASPS